MDERVGRPHNVPSILWNFGDMFMPKIIREKLDEEIYKVGNTPINNWSLVHMGSGFMMNLTNFSYNTAMNTHNAWEFYQVMIGMTNITREEEILDITLDSGFFSLGFLLGYLIKS